MVWNLRHSVTANSAHCYDVIRSAMEVKRRYHSEVPAMTVVRILTSAHK